MARDFVLEQVEELLSPYAKQLGLEFWGSEWTQEAGRKILRVYLEKENGVSLGDCENFSRLVDSVLDVENIISERYSLEVSSPGINRTLFKSSQYTGYVGKVLKIKTREGVEGRYNFKGTLKSLNDLGFVIEVDGINYEINFKNVVKALVHF